MCGCVSVYVCVCVRVQLLIPYVDWYALPLFTYASIYRYSRISSFYLSLTHSLIPLHIHSLILPHIHPSIEPAIGFIYLCNHSTIYPTMALVPIKRLKSSSKCNFPADSWAKKFVVIVVQYYRLPLVAFPLLRYRNVLRLHQFRSVGLTSCWVCVVGFHFLGFSVKYWWLSGEWRLLGQLLLS